MLNRVAPAGTAGLGSLPHLIWRPVASPPSSPVDPCISVGPSGLPPHAALLWVCVGPQRCPGLRGSGTIGTTQVPLAAVRTPVCRTSPGTGSSPLALVTGTAVLALFLWRYREQCVWHGQGQSRSEIQMQAGWLPQGGLCRRYAGRGGKRTWAGGGMEQPAETGGSGNFSGVLHALAVALAVLSWMSLGFMKAGCLSESGGHQMGTYRPSLTTLSCSSSGPWNQLVHC